MTRVVYDTLKKRVANGQTDKVVVNILEKKRNKDINHKELYERAMIDEVLRDGKNND